MPGPFVLLSFSLYFNLCFSATYGQPETILVVTFVDPKFDKAIHKVGNRMGFKLNNSLNTSHMYT